MATDYKALGKKNDFRGKTRKSFVITFYLIIQAFLPISVSAAVTSAASLETVKLVILPLTFSLLKNT